MVPISIVNEQKPDPQGGKTRFARDDRVTQRDGSL